MDPYNKYNDGDIWAALEKVRMTERIYTMSGRKDLCLHDNASQALTTNISGDILSVGEKQLLCLGRALLKRSKVILLDEATANVDNQTSQLVQSTLMKECSDCTVLAISHRLEQIMDYDGVIVMDKGEVHLIT